MRATKAVLILLLVVFGEFGIEPFANGERIIVGSIELSFSRTIIHFINTTKISNPMNYSLELYSILVLGGWWKEWKGWKEEHGGFGGRL